MPLLYSCPICGRMSANANDISELYCGFCHKFESAPERRLPSPGQAGAMRIISGGTPQTTYLADPQGRRIATKSLITRVEIAPITPQSQVTATVTIVNVGLDLDGEVTSRQGIEEASHG